MPVSKRCSPQRAGVVSACSRWGRSRGDAVWGAAGDGVAGYASVAGGVIAFVEVALSGHVDGDGKEAQDWVNAQKGGDGMGDGA